MAQNRNNTLMDPPIEDLLDKVDSKFTLVALSAKRARQINSYYNQLGEGLGMVVPPQVTSVSGKPLTIAFEEISAAKATYHRIEPGEDDEVEAAGPEGLVVAPDVAGDDLAGDDEAVALTAAADLSAADVVDEVPGEIAPVDPAAELPVEE
jgi:DNA-directed RNA polymerase subunit omega